MAEVLRIGTFFDGTGNHKDNDLQIQDGSSITNIAKLYESYNSEYKFYEHGPGTYRLSPEEIESINNGQKEKDDYFTLSGAAFGLDAHGKVESMLEKIDKVIKTHPNDTIVIDSFGFSRGATEARDFINHVNEKYKDNPNVQVGFSGLFDTVASIGFANEYNPNFNLNLSQNSAQQIVHFTAMNEYRSNFPLESLKSEQEELPENTKEIALIGAHSDLGGGYYKKEKEVIVLHAEEFEFTYDEDKEKRIEELKEKYSGSNQEVIVKYERDKPGALAEDFYHQRLVRIEVHETRTISNDLSDVALSAMYNEASASGVPFNHEQMNAYINIPKELESYHQAVLHGENDLDEYFNEVKGYIHQSSSDNRADVNWENVLANHKDWDGVRDVYFNEPNEAQQVNMNKQTSLLEEDKLSEILDNFNALESNFDEEENFHEQLQQDESQTTTLRMQQQ